MLSPAHEVVPDHVALLKLKAPMGLASFGFELCPFLIRQLQGGAVVDRGLAAGELAFALQLELLGRFVGGIKAAGRLPPLDRRPLKREAVRLADLQRPDEPEPGEVLVDAARKFLRRPLPVGVVETEDEASTPLPREQKIEQRGADIAGMKPPGGARRESDPHAHDDWPRQA